MRERGVPERIPRETPVAVGERYRLAFDGARDGDCGGGTVCRFADPDGDGVYTFATTPIDSPSRRMNPTTRFFP